MVKMIIYSLGVVGTWLLSDGLYSIIVYWNKPAYNDRIQTWRQDHWIRAVRCAIGLYLIIAGGLLWMVF